MLALACHGNDEAKVYKQFYGIVDEWVLQIKLDIKRFFAKTQEEKTMAITLSLGSMSVEEKFQTMESIWDGLCKNPMVYYLHHGMKKYSMKK